MTGPEAAGHIDLDAPVADNLGAVAQAKGVRIEDLTVVILNRPRNAAKIDACRKSGARIRLITDGDVAPSVMAALPRTGVDLVMGIGGTPEGIITACAMQGLSGDICARVAPQSDEERERVCAHGVDLKRQFRNDDLVSGEDSFFAATGITQGDFLKGVGYKRDGATTHSIVTRSRSRTWRV